jgi:hypothetical protein
VAARTRAALALENLALRQQLPMERAGLFNMGVDRETRTSFILG